jgi:Superinfection exclusion gene product 17
LQLAVEHGYAVRWAMDTAHPRWIVRPALAASVAMEFQLRTGDALVWLDLLALERPLWSGVDRYTPTPSDPRRTVGNGRLDPRVPRNGRGVRPGALRRAGDLARGGLGGGAGAVSPRPANPAQGALCVWWIPQIPMEAFHVPVADLAQAKLLLDALADYDRFQFENRVKPDYCNAGGLLIFEDGDWSDWYDPESGDDFDTYMESRAIAAAEATP